MTTDVLPPLPQPPLRLLRARRWKRPRPSLSSFLILALLLAPSPRIATPFLISPSPCAGGTGYDVPQLHASRGESENNDDDHFYVPNPSSSSKGTYSTTAAAAPADESSTTTTPHPRPILFSRTKQRRRPARRPRRPKRYWSDLRNVYNELVSFWEHDANVTLSSAAVVSPSSSSGGKYVGDPPTSPLPPIPNESLLMHFHRHDLRWGISEQGGREALSSRLGGARIVPGKWSEAVRVCPEVQQLIAPGNTKGWGLGIDRPPNAVAMSPSHVVKRKEGRTTTVDEQQPQHSAPPLSKKKEYWTPQRVVHELHAFVASYQKSTGRPSVYMPHMTDLIDSGRSDLKNAIQRFGGPTRIAAKAGLIPRSEWTFFETQLELFVELQGYLDDRRHHDNDDVGGDKPSEDDSSSSPVFPDPTEVLYRGYDNLYDLIKHHGGKKFLASKLDMVPTTPQRSKPSKNGMYIDDYVSSSWGPFSLDFALHLLWFVRNTLAKRSPPLQPAVIRMPTQEQLMAAGEDSLAKQIVLYGGYENVARRLGLAVSFETDEEMNSRIIEEEREDEGFSSVKGQEMTVQGKRTGPWDVDSVVTRLHQYVGSNRSEESGRRRQRPAVCMPKLSDIDDDELKHAISRFGGQNEVCRRAGLVPYQEWKRFESNLVMFEQLQEYMGRHSYDDNGSNSKGGTTTLPRLTEIRADGYEILHKSIRRFGGRKALVQAFGVADDDVNATTSRRPLLSSEERLDFVVRLLRFVRDEMMTLMPPSDAPWIAMPTMEHLISCGEVQLADDVKRHGGERRVARRLGLAVAEGSE